MVKFRTKNISLVESGVTLIEACVALLLFSLAVQALGLFLVQSIAIEKQSAWIAITAVLAFNMTEQSNVSTDVTITEWQMQLSSMFPGSIITINVSEKKGLIMPPPNALKLKPVEFQLY
jgi:Tfp pilus assembly protein PilV